MQARAQARGRKAACDSGGAGLGIPTFRPGVEATVCFGPNAPTPSVLQPIHGATAPPLPPPAHAAITLTGERVQHEGGLDVLWPQVVAAVRSVDAAQVKAKHLRQPAKGVPCGRKVGVQVASVELLAWTRQGGRGAGRSSSRRVGARMAAGTRGSWHERNFWHRRPQLRMLLQAGMQGWPSIPLVPRGAAHPQGPASRARRRPATTPTPWPCGPSAC